jgi:hypothetical protein
MNVHQPLTRSRPFAPEPAPLPLPPGNTFVRALTANVLAALHCCAPQEVAANRWPDDRVLAAFLTRTAANPAMTSVTGWAAELVAKTVADGIRALGPASCGAQLLQQGLVLTTDGGVVSAPGLVADFGGAGWVAEGDPIPVRALNITPATLNPHKLATIAVLTREMVEGSNAEAIIGDALMRAAGRIVDEILLDANPEAANRPAGLRNGITALNASNNSDAGLAIYEDVTALLNAVSAVAGAGPIALVANAGRVGAVGMRTAHVPNNITLLGSAAVGNDLLAVAPEALVAALAPEPSIEVARAATLHMDTAPQPVGSVNPHRSLFQTDSIALKMRWPITWALRDPRGFAWLTPSWK